MASAQKYSKASVAAMRDVVNMAYDEVEGMRRLKAMDERVEYVPAPRPTNMYTAEHCIEELNRLLAMKKSVDNWRAAGSDELPIAAIPELAKLLENFYIRIAVDAHEHALTVTRIQYVGNFNVRP